MAFEVAGDVPVPYPLAKTYVNRAWLNIQRSFLWSFLWGDAAIPTPAPTGAGFVTTQRGNAVVTANPAAAAAWATIPLSTPITTQQFRVGQGTIYNIKSYDNVANTITLDQPYVDPTDGPNTGYQILGIYFNAPVQDFLWWESIRDPITGYTLGTVRTREEVDVIDPQRFQSGWPVEVIPYRINPTPGSFYQFPQYEMWPGPLNELTYTGTYFRKGAGFQSLNDTVLAPLGEDVVLELAKYYACEWCLKNPDKVPKADWRFAMGANLKQYEKLKVEYEVMDEEFSHRHVIPSGQIMARPDLPWVSQGESLIYAP